MTRTFFILLLWTGLFTFTSCTDKYPSAPEKQADLQTEKSSCETCHLDKNILTNVAGSSHAADQVYVNPSFLESGHGRIECAACHGGQPKGFSFDAAHTDLKAHPSLDAVAACGRCHGAMPANQERTLHRTQNTFFNDFAARAGYDLRTRPTMLAQYADSYGYLAASCGSCHVNNAGSHGLRDEHLFEGEPTSATCNGCHNLPTTTEFAADAHRRGGENDCVQCHTRTVLHGNGAEPTSVYDPTNTAAPTCESCHQAEMQSNPYHLVHWASPTGQKLACQVCHSGDYFNFKDYTAGDMPEDLTRSSGFKIGRNPQKTSRHPYDYVVVRHSPIKPNSFSGWGEATLANFSARPTWLSATPHTIQRRTARTTVAAGEGCMAACHDSGYYLRAADLESYEVEANQSVIIP